MPAPADDLKVGPAVLALGVDTIALDFFVEDDALLEVTQSSEAAPLTLGVDYTFAGEGTDTGVVTLTTPANGTDTYTVRLVPILGRDADIQFRGDFRSPVFNLEVNRIWRAIQSISSSVANAFLFTQDSNLPAPLQSLTAAGRVGRVVGFTADGSGLALVTGVGGVTVPGATVDNSLVRWDGVTAQGLQDSSSVTLSDAGLMNFTGDNPTIRMADTNDASGYAELGPIDEAFSIRIDPEEQQANSYFYIDIDELTAFWLLPDGKVRQGAGVPAVALDLQDHTDAIRLPTGTTAQRPTPAAGMIRWNSTLSVAEIYNGTAWQTIGGACDLLETVTFAAATTGDFTALDNALYGSYLVDFENLVAVGATNINLNLQTSSDGGTSFDSAASDYNWVRKRALMNSTPTLSEFGDNADSSIYVSIVGDNADSGMSGSMRVSGAGDATVHTRFTWDMIHEDGANTLLVSGGGSRLAAGAVDALRFSASATMNGVARLYGFRK